MAYQHSAAASKGNAFCWESWQPTIQWGSRAQEDGQAKRQQTIEQKRAAGQDPLHIPFLSSATRAHPHDPVRFAMPRPQRATK